MKSLKLFLFLSGIVAMIVFGCKKDDENKIVNPLLIKTWVLTSMEDTKTNQMIDYPDSIMLKYYLVVEDSISLAYYGCGLGHYHAKYWVTDSKIKLYDIEYTHADLCFDENWEEQVFGNIERANRYKVTDDKLIIYSSGDYNLYFVP